MPNINLNQFTRLVDQTPESKLDSQAIKAKDGQLAKAGFFTFESTKRAAIDSFVAALRQEYGGKVADMIQNTVIRDLKASGKPLTARLVKDLTSLAKAEKARVNEHNSKVVNDFISGRTPDKSLERAVAAHCAKNLTSPEDAPFIREKVKAHLQSLSAKGGFHPDVLTPESLKASIINGISKFMGLGPSGAEAIISSLPGAVADRLRLSELGLGRDSSVSFGRCVHLLGAMRELQPKGELTLETVHKALFKEDAPVGLTGDKLRDAIETRCQKDLKTQLERWGAAKEQLFLGSSLFVPWEKLVSLAARPNTLTLDDVPSYKDYFKGQFERSNVKNGLQIDLCRNGAGEPQVKSTPTLSFHFPGKDGQAHKEEIQVGAKTNFQFANEADKTAYLKGQESSLSRRLETLCQEFCGEGATERQVTSVMACLTQNALTPLRWVSSLAGTDFYEHSNAKRVLTRQPDGTIKADFSSPPEMKDAKGQFRLSLTIAKDGTMTVTEFEITPPLEIRQQRDQEAANEAAKVRINETLARSVPFRALDDSPEGLFTQIRDRAKALDSGAKLTDPQLWSALNSDIGQRLQKMAQESAVPLTEAQIKEVRQAVVDEFFNKLDAVKAKVPEAQRDVFVRGCLELALVPDESLLPAMGQMTGTVTHAYGAILKAKDGNEVLGLMTDLQGSMRAATLLNPDFKGKDAGFFLPAQMLAMRLGLLNLMGGDNPEALAKTLNRPGPYRDMLHLLAGESSVDKNNAEQAHNWLLGGLVGILPDTTLQQSLNIYNIRERDLSLARQREILGQGNYATRGVGVAVPELAGLDQSLKKDMPVLKEHIRVNAEEDLRLGPGNEKGTKMGPRLESGLSEQFMKDFKRDGLFVNGRYYHPKDTKTTEQDFINLFPDSRTAGLLSNLAGQNLPGLYMRSLMEAPTSGDLILQHVLANPDMLDQKKLEQNARIDTLNADQGLYRITFFQNRTSGNPESGVERFMFEVSVEVNLGPPGANPPPAPVVKDVQLDMLFRGREAAPGEKN